MSFEALTAGSLMAVVMLVATALALWLMRRERAGSKAGGSGGGGGRGARYRRLREGDPAEPTEDEAEAAGQTQRSQNGANGHASAPSDTTRAAHSLLDDAETALASGDAAGALRMIEDAVLLAGEDPMVVRRADVLRSRVA